MLVQAKTMRSVPPRAFKVGASPAHPTRPGVPNRHSHRMRATPAQPKRQAVPGTDDGRNRRWPGGRLNAAWLRKLTLYRTPHWCAKSMIYNTIWIGNIFKWRKFIKKAHG